MSNEIDTLGFGTIVFFQDKNTGDIRYAIDGEDNKKYISYLGVKEGCLATPLHLSTYDLWFNNLYSETEIKGFLTLRKYGSESFNIKSSEIETRLKNLYTNSMYGKISVNGEKIFITSNYKSNHNIKGLLRYFIKRNSVNDNTLVVIDNKNFGSIGHVLESSEIEKSSMNKEHKIVASWVDEYNKTGNKEVLEKIFDKYLPMIKGRVRSNMNQYNIKEAHFNDMLQECSMEFLRLLPKLDTKKASLSTYTYVSIDGIAKKVIRQFMRFNTRHTLVDNDTLNTKSIKADTCKNMDSNDFMCWLLSFVHKPAIRQAMYEHYVNKKKFKAISIEMDTTIQRVGQLLEEGKGIMRRALRRNNIKSLEEAKIRMLFE